MGIGYGDLPDADVRGDGGKQLSQSQRRHSSQVVAPAQVWGRRHIEHGQCGAQETVECYEMNHGEGHRVREHAENLFPEDVVGGTETVPAHAQRDYLEGLLSEGFLCHGDFTYGYIKKGL